MARIAGFRAEIDTNAGCVSRLGKDYIQTRANDRKVCLEIRGWNTDNGNGWLLNVYPVLSISSNGAVTGGHFARLVLDDDDMEALKAGKVKLALVPVE